MKNPLLLLLITRYSVRVAALCWHLHLIDKSNRSLCSANIIEALLFARLRTCYQEGFYWFAERLELKVLRQEYVDLLQAPSAGPLFFILPGSVNANWTRISSVFTEYLATGPRTVRVYISLEIRPRAPPTRHNSKNAFQNHAFEGSLESLGRPLENP